MMQTPEQSGAEPSVIEKRDKAPEATDKQSKETVEGLTKQLNAQKTSNEKLGKIAAQEGGDNGTENKEQGSELLEKLLIEELRPSMQQGLDMNTETDFPGRETDRLLSDYSRAIGSEAYVASHTPESLAGALPNELNQAFNKFKQQSPDHPLVTQMEGANAETATNVVKSAMLKSLQIVKGKIKTELMTEKRGNIDPDKVQEQRQQNGDQVKTVRAAPNDATIGMRGRNSMRDFRNAIYKAETPDGIRYDRLSINPPNTAQEKDAAKQFNVLAEKFDDALAVVGEDKAEGGPTKNVRALLVKDYGEELVKNPISDPKTLPTFKAWLEQHGDKVKAVTEEAAKRGE